MDLAEAVEFDSAAADENIQRVRPGMQVLKVSAKTGIGFDDWIQFLTQARTFKLRVPETLTVS